MFNTGGINRMNNISDKIRQERNKKNLSQKNLADLLSVNIEDIQSWEEGKVMPDVDQLIKISEVLQISMDELVGKNTPKPTPTPYVNYGICDSCHNPLKGKEDIHDIYTTKKVCHGRGYHTEETKERYCSACYKKYKEEENRKKEQARRALVEDANKRRLRVKFLCPLLCVLIGLLIAWIVYANTNNTLATVLSSILGAIYVFPLLGCLFLNNNCVFMIVASIWSVFFLKFPGVIFEFGMDGFVALIAIKILFAIIGFLVGAVGLLSGLAIASIVAVFIFIPSYRKSIDHPEIVEL
jgi:transcriptional regulator with XRE-family HTH domain